MAPGPWRPMRDVARAPPFPGRETRYRAVSVPVTG